MASLVEHPLRHRTEDLQALFGWVIEDQLLDRQQVPHPDQPVYELRRIRRARSDDSEFHSASSAFARAIFA